MDLERFMLQRFNDMFAPFEDEHLVITCGEPNALAAKNNKRAHCTSMMGAKMDLLEKADQYVVNAELPGVSKEDIHVQLEGNRLSILAERKEEKKEDADRYHYRERSFGSIKRVITLPEQADTEKVKAEFQAGVLSLSFAKKSDDFNRRTITIS